MRRVAVLAALVVFAAAVIGADAATPGFRYGVAAGEVTSNFAVLWTRASAAGVVRLEVRQGARVVATRELRAAPATDLTVQARVTGLLPGRRYTYRFRRGARVSELGAFTTAPAPNADARVRFAITGDADATPDTNGKPAWGFGVYARMAAERNDFNLNVGDTIYSDSERRRTARREDGCREVGEVQARACAARAPEVAAVGGSLQPLGRPRVRQRLLAPGARRGALPRERAGVRPLLAGADRSQRALPQRPLGKEPRALLPRRAVVPQREGDERVRRRSRADRAAGGPERVRDSRPHAREPCVGLLPRRDRRPRADDARPAPVRGVHGRDRGFDRDVEGRRQRGADPAVLRASVRPLGGIRRRARAAAPLPPGATSRTSSS